VDIHVTAEHTEYCKCEKPGSKWQLVDNMGYTSFLPESTYVSFYQEAVPD